MHGELEGSPIPIERKELENSDVFSKEYYDALIESVSEKQTLSDGTVITKAPDMAKIKELLLPDEVTKFTKSFVLYNSPEGQKPKKESRPRELDVEGIDIPSLSDEVDIDINIPQTEELANPVMRNLDEKVVAENPDKREEFGASLMPKISSIRKNITPLPKKSGEKSENRTWTREKLTETSRSKTVTGLITPKKRSSFESKLEETENTDSRSKQERTPRIWKSEDIVALKPEKRPVYDLFAPKERKTVGVPEKIPMKTLSDELYGKMLPTLRGRYLLSEATLKEDLVDAKINPDLVDEYVKRLIEDKIITKSDIASDRYNIYQRGLSQKLEGVRKEYDIPEYIKSEAPEQESVTQAEVTSEYSDDTPVMLDDSSVSYLLHLEKTSGEKFEAPKNVADLKAYFNKMPKDLVTPEAVARVTKNAVEFYKTTHKGEEKVVGAEKTLEQEPPIVEEATSVSDVALEIKQEDVIKERGVEKVIQDITNPDTLVTLPADTRLNFFNALSKLKNPNPKILELINKLADDIKNRIETNLTKSDVNDITLVLKIGGEHLSDLRNKINNYNFVNKGVVVEREEKFERDPSLVAEDKKFIEKNILRDKLDTVGAPNEITINEKALAVLQEFAPSISMSDLVDILSKEDLDALLDDLQITSQERARVYSALHKKDSDLEVGDDVPKKELIVEIPNEDPVVIEKAVESDTVIEEISLESNPKTESELRMESLVERLKALSGSDNTLVTDYVESTILELEETIKHLTSPDRGEREKILVSLRIPEAVKEITFTEAQTLLLDYAEKSHGDLPQNANLSEIGYFMTRYNVPEKDQKAMMKAFNKEVERIVVESSKNQ